jgi:hypothetical protein
VSINTAIARESPSTGLRNAVSPLSFVILVSSQLYLLWMIATSHWSFSQVMLMNGVEMWLAWLVTTIFFSRTLSGLLLRCRDLIVMAIAISACMLVFGWLELKLGGSSNNEDFWKWLATMRAMLASGNFQLGLLYIGMLALMWLSLAWQSGRPRQWWVANVGATQSVTFAAMFVSFAVGTVLIVAFHPSEDGGTNAHDFAHTLRNAAPLGLAVLFSASRVFFSWGMAALLPPESWRQIEAQFFFDQVQAPEA